MDKAWLGRTCKHCAALEPKWLKAVPEIPEDVAVGEMEGNENIRCTMRMGVKAYPTIFVSCKLQPAHTQQQHTCSRANGLAWLPCLSTSRVVSRRQSQASPCQVSVVAVLRDVWCVSCELVPD